MSCDTRKTLREIHRSMLSRLKPGGSQKNQAKIIEEFFNQIKFYQKMYQNNQSGFNELFLNQKGKAFQLAMKNSKWFSLIYKLYNIHPNLIKDLNLINTNFDSYYSQGMALENGVAQIIKSLETYGTQGSNRYSFNYEYDLNGNARTKKTGGFKMEGMKDIEDIISEEEAKLAREFYNEIGQEMRLYEDSSVEIKGASMMGRVDIKIDNIGLNANFSYWAHSEIEASIMNALKGATFTSKNYLSTNNIHFGSTNPFRVFLIVSKNHINNFQDQLSAFHGMLKCFEKGHTTYKTFYRIRAIYEITGLGINPVMDDITKSAIYKQLYNRYAEYLIWNTPYGKLSVIPTADIVSELIKNSKKFLPNNWRDALYGPIEIPQTDLNSISNKNLTII